MKRVGYRPDQAGAVEVSSSVNGQIMPPVMGAAAFLMVEYVGIPYTEVIKHAFLPAIISYIALFYIVHLEALKADLKGLPRRSQADVGQRLVSFAIDRRRFHRARGHRLLRHRLAQDAAAGVGDLPHRRSACSPPTSACSGSARASPSSSSTTRTHRSSSCPRPTPTLLVRPALPAVGRGADLVPDGRAALAGAVGLLGDDVHDLHHAHPAPDHRRAARPRRLWRRTARRLQGPARRPRGRRAQHDRHRRRHRGGRHHRRHRVADRHRPGDDRGRRAAFGRQPDDHAGARRRHQPGARHGAADDGQLHRRVDADGAGGGRARRAERPDRAADRGAPVRLLLRPDGRRHAAGRARLVRGGGDRAHRPDQDRRHRVLLQHAHGDPAVPVHLQHAVADDRHRQRLAPGADDRQRDGGDADLRGRHAGLFPGALALVRIAVAAADHVHACSVRATGGTWSIRPTRTCRPPS